MPIPISGLPSLIVPGATDTLAIVDNAGAITKKITRNNLLSGTPLPANIVDNNSIANNSVTNAKLNTAAGEIGGVWSSFTNTGMTAETGTITSGTVTGRYKIIGKTVFMQMVGSITSNGTGAGSVRLNFPSAVAPSVQSQNYVASGREDAVSGHQLQGKIDATNNRLQVFKYDASYAGANGAVLRMFVTYEIA